MDEFNLQVAYTPAQITFDIDGLKEYVSEKVKVYENVVVTEDNVKLAKKDIAALRKVAKSIDDRRKEIKKNFTAPLTEFEKSLKEVNGLIDNVVNPMDKQVKAIENGHKEERRNECAKMFAETLGELIGFVSFDSAFRDSWLNSSVSDKSILDDMQVIKISVQNDVSAIRALQSEIEDKLFDTYRTDGLAAAIKQNSEYIALKKEAETKIDEQFKKEPPIVGIPDKAEAIFMNEPTMVFQVFGLENIERVKNFLDFSEIEYQEV